MPRSGTLVLAARRDGARTVLARVRYDGIARCSRAFADGDAARIVLSHLGPGVMRDDAVVTVGTLGPGAHLIVTQQTATRILGAGPRRASAQAQWEIGTGARLDLVGEPLVALDGANYETTTVVALEPGACVVASDIVYAAPGTNLRTRTIVQRADRELVYDALDAGRLGEEAVGTLVVAGPDPLTLDALVRALDETSTSVRVGIGRSDDALLARLGGAEPWAIRTALDILRAVVRRTLDAGRAIHDGGESTNARSALP